jgi:hypothetical protein
MYCDESAIVEKSVNWPLKNSKHLMWCERPECMKINCALLFGACLLGFCILVIFFLEGGHQCQILEEIYTCKCYLAC